MKFSVLPKVIVAEMGSKIWSLDSISIQNSFFQVLSTGEFQKPQGSKLKFRITITSQEKVAGSSGGEEQAKERKGRKVLKPQTPLKVQG